MDDTTLMGLGKIKQVVNFWRALDLYLDVLGQRINENKSSIFFFDTPRLIQNRIG